jgi:hypothetical protein
MKKLFYLSLALCFFTALTSAQKVTQKDLQGKWKLTYFKADGLEFDIVKEKITISDEAKDVLPPEMLQQLQGNSTDALAPFKEAYAVFLGDKLQQILGPEVKECAYTITEKDGQQFIHATFEDGATDDTAVAIKDKQLYLTISGDGDDAEMIYSKEAQVNK